MSEKAKVVKQSINKIQVVGEVSEINLKDEVAKTKIRDNKGVEHEIERWACS